MTLPTWVKKRGFPSWLEKHSVSCIACGKLIDERESEHTEKGFNICKECYDENKEYEV